MWWDYRHTKHGLRSVTTVCMANTMDKDRKPAPKERIHKDSSATPEQKAAAANKKAKEPKAPKPDRGVAPGITG
jgi:hypothetical protein